MTIMSGVAYQVDGPGHRSRATHRPSHQKYSTLPLSFFLGRSTGLAGIAFAASVRFDLLAGATNLPRLPLVRWTSV